MNYINFTGSFNFSVPILAMFQLIIIMAPKELRSFHIYKNRPEYLTRKVHMISIRRYIDYGSIDSFFKKFYNCYSNMFSKRKLIQEKNYTQNINFHFLCRDGSSHWSNTYGSCENHILLLDRVDPAPRS